MGSILQNFQENALAGHRGLTALVFLGLCWSLGGCADTVATRPETGVQTPASVQAPAPEQARIPPPREAVAADGGASLCTVLPLLPGTRAEPADEARRRALCGIDFASPDTAVCPKNWSTSPAALVYDLAGTGWAGRAPVFEREVCPLGTRALASAGSELAVFKHSMNYSDTSATYAPAALLYDHLSRWLGLRLRVPVAVRQAFPLAWYGERVVSPGLALAGQHSSRKMLLAGWQRVAAALAASEPQSSTAEFITADGGYVWGASLLFTGRRYGPEVNGTRASGWGSGQNRDFQRTAPFLLLRDGQPLAAAARAALLTAREDPAMATALPADTDLMQIQWWAGEILEIVVLDYILGQQDRVGNIDYEHRWLWWRAGTLHSEPAASGMPAPDPEAKRLRVSWLNDNDAGVRSGYADFAERTGMLDGLRHFDPGLYRRLRELAADFRSAGELHGAIGSHYGIRGRELAAIAGRLQALDEIISAACRQGRYRFDLAPRSVLAGGEVAAESVDCG